MFTFRRNGQALQLAVVFLVAFLPRTVFAEEKPCTVHDNGKFYDLSHLKASKDYTIETSTKQLVSLNICQNVKTELWGLKDDVEAGDVGAFVRKARGDFVLGKVNSTLSVVDSKPRLVLSAGSKCKSSSGELLNIRASAIIEFTCDTSIFGPGQPRLLAQLPPGDDEVGCAYVIDWRTHYACPTSEVGGFWGFLAILAVIFLILLMTYTVLGTLYNRYVLQLRGFDQIPQFSIESMKYHVSEATDWIKDVAASFDVGGRGGSGNLYGGVPTSAAPRSATNPVSHHSQAAGLSSNNNDLEENIGSLGAGGGFIRPQPGKNRAAAFQRYETNPVSHQTQVNAQSLSFSNAKSSQSPPRPPPKDDRPVPRRLGSESKGAVPDEREFMLGGDDDDAEELGEVIAPPDQTATPISSPPQPTSSTGGNNSNAADIDPSPPAQGRGRDLGGGDAILL